MPIPTTLKRLLRPALAPARAFVERSWRACFWASGRLARTATRRWSSSGGQRVLVVAPHPDDETAGCGGTLMAHVAAGDEVHALFVTDGRRSRALGLAPDEMAARRRDEARGAVGALGLSGHTWLGLREGEWELAQGQPLLSGSLKAFRPDVVYAPSRFDFHPEHVRTAFALGSVLADSLPANARVRIYGIQVPLTAILVNLVCATGAPDALAPALSAYETQAASLLASARPHLHAAAYHGLDGLAEEFWELSPAAYAALHEGDPPARPWLQFRGIHPQPWSDPLAYLVGRAARRAARRRVSAASIGGV
ncbi:MAG: PIG-L family deacetylase [Thermoanaerobaculia bacterium]